MSSTDGTEAAGRLKNLLENPDYIVRRYSVPGKASPQAMTPAQGMTPEEFIDAVKKHPRVMYIKRALYNWADVRVEHGYATRRYVDNDTGLEMVECVPDWRLSKSFVTRAAAASSPDRLRPDEVRPAANCILESAPSDAELRAYYLSKHRKPGGLLSFLFPASIERQMKDQALLEWAEEQVILQEKQAKEQRARKLWTRYYCMFDKHHVSEMSGKEFERFVGRLYTRIGYSVSLTAAGADQGVDLILCKDGRKIAVQAKRRRAVVGNAAVQEVISGKLYYGCSHGVIVTNSRFSKSAVELAAKDPTISLVDGQDLSRLCEQLNTEPVPEFSLTEWEKIKHVAELLA
jgi:hypothetical protein